MQEQNKTQPADDSQKNKRTDFFEKIEMNNEVNDDDNAGDNSFTPIYLNDNNVLQTPEEKKHDEGINAQQNDKLEAVNPDANETLFDKLNNNAQRHGMNE